MINSINPSFSWENVSIYVPVSSILFYGLQLYPPEILGHQFGLYTSDPYDTIQLFSFVLTQPVVVLILLLFPLVLPTPILFSKLGEKLNQRYPRIFPRNPSQSKVILILYISGLPLYLAGNPSTYEAVNGFFPYWLFRIGPYIKSVTTGPFYILFDSISNFSAPYVPTVLVMGFGAILSGILVWVWISVLSRVGIEIVGVYEGLVDGTWKHVTVFVIMLGMITAMAGVYIFFPTYLSGVEKAPLKETAESPQSLSDGSVKPWLKKYAKNITHNELVREFKVEGTPNSYIAHLTGTDVLCHSPTVISESSEGKYVSVICAGSAEYTYNWGLLRTSILYTPNLKQIYFVNRSGVNRIRNPLYNSQVLRPGIVLSNVEIRDENIHEPYTYSYSEAINLSGATLTNVTLRTDSSVNLADSSLTNVTLRIYNTDREGSVNLTHSSLTNVALRTNASVDLTHSSLNNVTLRHNNIMRVRLTGSNVRNSVIKQIDPFTPAYPDYSIRDASFRDSRLSGLSLRYYVGIKNTTFQNISCTNCNLKGTTLSDVEISDSVFIGSTREEINTRNTNFTNVTFRAGSG